MCELRCTGWLAGWLSRRGLPAGSKSAHCASHCVTPPYPAFPRTNERRRSLRALERASGMYVCTCAAEQSAVLESALEQRIGRDQECAGSVYRGVHAACPRISIRRRTACSKRFSARYQQLDAQPVGGPVRCVRVPVFQCPVFRFSRVPESHSPTVPFVPRRREAGSWFAFRWQRNAASPGAARDNNRLAAGHGAALAAWLTYPGFRHRTAAGSCADVCVDADGAHDVLFGFGDPSRTQNAGQTWCAGE